MVVDLILHIVELQLLMNDKPDPSKGERQLEPVQSLKVTGFPELHEKVYGLGGFFADDLPVKVLVSMGHDLTTNSMPEIYKSRVIDTIQLLDSLKRLKAGDNWSVKAAVAYLKEVPYPRHVVVTEWDL